LRTIRCESDDPKSVAPTTIMTLTACWLFAMTAHRDVTSYGKTAVRPGRSGLEKIWRGLAEGRTGFCRVEISS